MKNYYLFVASFLLLCDFGYAQTPVTLPGGVSVNVIKHLEFKLIKEPNQLFRYSETDPDEMPGTIERSMAEVTIAANVNWKFSIVTANGETVLRNKTKTSETIDANKFNYSASGTGITGGSQQPLGPTCLSPILGSKNLGFKLYWQVKPKITGNLYAGDYVVDINYVLSEQ